MATVLPVRPRCIHQPQVGLVHERGGLQRVIWLLVGRNPAAGTIVVRYEPPENLSPASMRYLLKAGLDEKAFTAALVDMVAKGFLEIEERGDSYVVSRGVADESVLAADEKALAGELIPRGLAFELTSENHERIYQAIRAMKHALDIGLEGVYLRMHRGFLLPGAIASGLLFLYLALQTKSEYMFHALFLVPFSLVWTLATLIVLLYARHAWNNARWLKGRSGSVPDEFGPAMSFAAVFLVSDIGILVWLAFVTQFWFPALLMFHAILFILAYIALKSPTNAGRGLLDQIEGFRRFVLSTDADRLNLINPPQRTPELFEKYLAYAFAFDAQEQWVAKFADIAAVSSVGDVETAAGSVTQAWATLDLSSFGLFIERWFPFELGEISVSVGPMNST